MLERYFAAYDRELLEEGELLSSRVRNLRLQKGVLHADVIEAGAYKLTLLLGTETSPVSRIVGHCTCAAFARRTSCKHEAAVLLALDEAGLLVPAEPTTNAARPINAADAAAVQQLLSLVGEGDPDTFLARLRLYDHALTKYSMPAALFGEHTSGWWARIRAKGAGPLAELLEHLARLAPAALRDIKANQNWQPEPQAYPAGFPEAWPSLMSKLVADERARSPRHAMVLSPQAMSPSRWDVRWDMLASQIRVREMGELVAGYNVHFTVQLHRTETGRVSAEISAAPTVSAESDAVRLPFARIMGLRAIDDAARDPKHALHRALIAYFTDAPWERLLRQVGDVPADSEDVSEPMRWHVDKEYSGFLGFSPLQKAGPKAKQPYKSISFKALGEQSDKLDAHDLEIFERISANVATASRARLPPTSATTHSVLRILADTGRAVIDAKASRPLRLVCGKLTMVFDGEDGDNVTSFRVGEEPVDIAHLINPRKESDVPDRVTYEDRGVLYAVTVPRELVPWILLAHRQRGELRFPPEANLALRAKLLPLQAAGATSLPASLRGKVTAANTQAGLSIEWREGGYAAAKVVASVSEHVPLVDIAKGPREINFEIDGQLYEVHRDFDAEFAAGQQLAPKIAEFLDWFAEERTGYTTDQQSYVALIDFLNQHPDQRVEVKKGRKPRFVAWDSTERSLEVTENKGWFQFRGHLQLGDTRVPFADVLDAVRSAAGYIQLADGDLLKLPDDARAALTPLAFASELAPDAPGGDTAEVHAAFLQDVLGATDAFNTSKQSDAVLRAAQKLALQHESGKKKQQQANIERGTLRKYQAAGVRWALELAEWAPGGVLADDMGLGKTVQAASVLLARAHGGPALVVTPASVGFNWKAELARFAPSLHVRWFHEDKEIDLTALGQNDVLVVSYNALQLQSARFSKLAFDTVILDEAQFVKNTDSLRAEAVRSLTKRFTLALSGTPMENHLGELWSIFDVVFPGLLGARERFHTRFRKPIESGIAPERLAVLSRLTAPFVLRRTRGEVLRDLPKQETVIEHVELDAAHAKKYEALRKASEMQFVDKDQRLTAAQRKIQILAALMKLRQLACDASLVDSSYQGTSAKLLRIVEICQAAKEQGDAVLVFSQFTSLLEKIDLELRQADLSTLYLDGGTDASKRGELVSKFQAGEGDVFCISLGAGGTGLNLTRATYVVHADPWWNPAVEDQATARAHRMGQTRPVTAYKLVARGTIEEAILAMQDKKRALVSSVMDGTASTKAGNIDELLALLRSTG